MICDSNCHANVPHKIKMESVKIIATADKQTGGIFCDPAGRNSFEQIVGVYIDQPQIKRFPGSTGDHMSVLDGVPNKPGTVFF